MKRHEFEVHPGATGMVCTAMVADADGFGDSCGLPPDDEMHQSRYDEYTSFWLRERPGDFEEESGIPVHAHLCRDCGVVVVDTAHHDRFHRLHPDPNDPNEETS